MINIYRQPYAYAAFSFTSITIISTSLFLKIERKFFVLILEKKINRTFVPNFIKTN